jgi:hypothetical protein
MIMHEPIGFPGLERYTGGDAADSRFTVVAMFTDAYARLAARLRASLEEQGLRYALFEVPSVHRSISARGNDDQSLTKPALVSFAQRRYHTPILYLDSDVVVRAPLVRIVELCEARRDFAIYNWLADEHTDCFIPFEAPGLPSRRFYRFSHSIDEYAPEQLICSGAVQYWADSPAAADLLGEWADCIRRFPRAADDQCLDFAFNNSAARRTLAYAWLDKAYARYAWWPYVRPVIDHPQIAVDSNHEPIASIDGRRRVYPSGAELRDGPRLIPRDCLVDVVEGGLYRERAREPDGNVFELVRVGRLETPLFPAL